MKTFISLTALVSVWLLQAASDRIAWDDGSKSRNAKSAMQYGESGTLSNIWLTRNCWLVTSSPLIDCNTGAALCYVISNVLHRYEETIGSWNWEWAAMKSVGSDLAGPRSSCPPLRCDCWLLQSTLLLSIIISYHTCPHALIIIGDFP